MKVRDEAELNILKRIKSNDQVKEAIPKPSEKKAAIQVKPICLLVGYMNDILKEEELNHGELRKDLENILRAIPSYIDIIL